MPVRQIFPRRGSAVGKFPSLKMQRMIAFESLLERDFIYLLDQDAEVAWFEEQPVRIAYQDEAKLLHYTPDFHLVECGKHVLVECKPTRFVASDENRPKFAAAQAWCASQGWEFRLVTEQQVRGGCRLANVKLLTQYARQPPDPGLCSQIYACLQAAPARVSIQEVAQRILPAHPGLVNQALLYLGYHHRIELPLEEALLSPETEVFLLVRQPKEGVR